MKVKELVLRNYKGFGPDAAPISFCDELGNVNDVTVIVGPNGSGKSSVLQAIAMLVGTLVRRGNDPRKLIWPGYKFDYVTNSDKKPELIVTVEFSNKENQVAIELYESATKEKYGGHSFENDAVVYLDSKRDLVIPAKGAIQQFGAYYFAMKTNGGDQTLSQNLSRVGGIFWYPEQREATNIHKAFYSGNFEGTGIITNSELRNILLRWYAFRDAASIEGGSNKARDRFGILQKLFERVFPGRTINRLAPDSSPEKIMEDALVWFRDENGHEYELSNASAGERAILPILIDFANWEINNSIILIDEIELHLHPPLQQALIRALPQLGSNNQFIITTHSDYVASMFFDSEIIRLPL